MEESKTLRMEFKFNINAKGNIRQRESSDLEFKESFHRENIPFYLRSLAGMANNKGGYIIFGVKNSPHVPCGLKNDKFQNCDPAEINQKVNEYFSHDFEWYYNLLEYDGKTFGQIYVPESVDKPIICKKHNEKCKLREGAIYYRYRGETKEIAYPELIKLIEKEKEKEKLLWMEHIQKISSVGPKNIHILDAYKGELQVGTSKILLNKEDLNKIKFIKEGAFVEKGGAPALILKGEITGTYDSNSILATDDIYPLFNRDLQNELGLNSHKIKCILWKLNIKGDKRYHSSIKSSAKNEIHKYSKRLIELIRHHIGKTGWLEKCVQEFSQNHPVTSVKGKIRK